MLLNPIFLLNSSETEKQSMKNSEVNFKEKSALSQKITKTLATFIRIELCLEVFYQVASQIILLLLNRTKTSTTGGLETIFEGDSEILGITFSSESALILSIVMSLKTCITTHLGAKLQ